MKNLYVYPILLFVFLVPTFTFAQIFTFSPSSEYEMNVDTANFTVHQVNIINETNSELALSWRIVEYDVPEEWEVVLCDNGICYDSFPNSNAFIPISNDERAFIKWTVHPHGSAKSATMKMRIFESDTPSDFEILTFTFNPILISHIAPRFPSSQPKIFPNPARDILHINTEIELGTYFQIYAITGHLLFETKNTAIDISNLNEGLYILKTNHPTTTHSTKFIVKR